MQAPHLLRIGANSVGGATNFFDGNIGYVKIGKATSFVYSGFKDQKQMVGISNIGLKIVAETKGGLNAESGFDTNASYDEVGIIGGDTNEASIVDSFDQIMQFDHALVQPGSDLQLKITAGRGSERNQSSIQGINFRFNK